MPLEIRELIIKATIVQDGSGASEKGPSPASNNDISSNEEIIKSCVEQIMEILKKKDDR